MGVKSSGIIRSEGARQLRFFLPFYKSVRNYMSCGYRLGFIVYRRASWFALSASY
jgi:hypothetical protein